jgi:hypothetical protein
MNAAISQSLRSRNDTIYRIVIVARKIINTGVIYVVSSITHNDRSRGIGKNIVSSANRNISPGPFYRNVSTRTFDSFATPRAFKCSPPSRPGFRISHKAGKNHDCHYKKNRDHDNTLF